MKSFVFRRMRLRITSYRATQLRMTWMISDKSTLRGTLYQSQLRISHFRRVAGVVAIL